MSELTNGDGYTTGGSVCTFSNATGGSTSNSSTLSWTASGTSWSISGIEIWDTAGTPFRHWFGSWAGEPISIGSGDTFAVAAGAIVLNLS
jgi:hypothetical protein